MGSWFVGDNYLRFIDQCPGNGNPLLLATREIRHPFLRFETYVKSGHYLGSPVLHLANRYIFRVEGQKNIFLDTDIFEKIKLLKDETEGLSPHFRKKTFRQFRYFSGTDQNAA